MTNHNQPPHEDTPGPAEDRHMPLDDLIDDALTHARQAGGEVPGWGARAIARALTQLQSADPYEMTALQQFASTGTGDPEQITVEALQLYNAPDATARTREWVNYLGTYLIHEPPADPPAAETEDRLAQVDTYLNQAFEEADRAGTPISRDDARAIAAIAARLLPAGSAMRAFADTGQLNTDGMRDDVEALQARALQIPQLRATWLPRLSRFLDDVELPTTEAALSGQATEGIATYGNAFRAYLTLPDIDGESADVLEGFHANYVGSFIDTTDLLERLTELATWRTQVHDFAAGLGIEHLVNIDLVALERQVRDIWDIVTYEGMLYAFEK